MYIYISYIIWIVTACLAAGRQRARIGRGGMAREELVREGGEGAGPHEVPYPGFSGRVWVWVACLKNLGGLQDGMNSVELG